MSFNPGMTLIGLLFLSHEASEEAAWAPAADPFRPWPGVIGLTSQASM